MSMITGSYTVRFLTPAFLGEAEQNGAWRTPPFKALLRQWWRVAYVRGREPTTSLVSQMREAEGRLFGNAWLEANDDDRAAGHKTGHCRSVIRMRLETENGGDAWTLGTQLGVDPLSKSLDTSYSWFGLIKRKGRATKEAPPDRKGIKVGVAEGSRVLKPPATLSAGVEARVAMIPSTERTREVRQRIGQDVFREALFEMRDGRCAISGIRLPSVLLRASHAKPWADSDDTERLDPFNGLLLAVHYDALFDAGLTRLQITEPCWSRQSLTPNQSTALDWGCRSTMLNSDQGISRPCHITAALWLHGQRA